MDDGLNRAWLAGQNLAGRLLPVASLGVEAGSPSLTAFPPFPFSFCSSWDVVEHSGAKRNMDTHMPAAQ